MKIKLNDVVEKFIIYYSTNNNIQIYSTKNKITIDEFITYNPPCRECLVQGMCINENTYISHLIRINGINIKLCEKLKRFVKKNRSLFNRVKFKNVY